MLRCVLFICGCMASTLYAFIPTAYVCNSANGTVSSVEVVESPMLPVGTNPSAIAITPDQSTLCVCNTTAGTVSIIDIATGGTQTVTVGGAPIAIAITPAGTKACVCNSAGNSVSVIDLSSLSVTNISLTGHPLFITILPDGSSAFVSCDNGEVVVFDPVTSSIITTISIADTGPITTTPDGSKVCLAGGAGLRIINPHTFAVTTVSLTEPTNKIAITPDNTQACLLGINRLFVVDLTTLATQSEFVGNTASDLAITKDSSQVLVSQSFPSGVEIFTLNPLAFGPTFYFGGNNEAIAITSDGKQACIVDPRSSLEPGTLWIFDILTHSVSGQMLGIQPNALVISSPVAPNPPVAPNAPKKFIGKIKRYSHKKRALCLRWKNSSPQDIAFYEIFAFHKKIATVLPDTQSEYHQPIYSPFLFCQKIPKRYYHRLHKKYRIRAVSSNGLASAFTSVTFPHLK